MEGKRLGEYEREALVTSGDISEKPPWGTRCSRNRGERIAKEVPQILYSAQINLRNDERKTDTGKL